MLPGETIGKYTLLRDLGEGGMGRVYAARDAALDREVALKVVLPAPGETEGSWREATARLFREARAAAKLHHPNVVTIFDVGDADGTPYLAMELIRGWTLREAMRDPRIRTKHWLVWLAEIARALAAAHRAGIVHRDIKPENVMIGEDGVLKVLDFGIARRTRSEADPGDPTLPTLSTAGLPAGTPLYMTPEQISGDEVDGRADQFAWGVVAYELLTGSVPWKKKNDALGLVAAILTQRAPGVREKAPDVPPEVEKVIARCLSKSPADRFDTMDEVVAALEEAQSAPAGDGAAHRYTDEEIREIVARASERQEGDERISHEELLEIAREIGLDERAVDAAARDLAREKEARDRQARDEQIRDDQARERQARAARQAKEAPAAASLSSLAKVALSGPAASAAGDRGAYDEEERRIQRFVRNLKTYVIGLGIAYVLLPLRVWYLVVLASAVALGLELRSVLLSRSTRVRRDDHGAPPPLVQSPEPARIRIEDRVRTDEHHRIIEAGVQEVLCATQRRRALIAKSRQRDRIRVSHELRIGHEDEHAAAEEEITVPEPERRKRRR